ncbi:MAG: aminotransferase class-V family protein [Devosia sp.]|nr:aminotransferase class-V family protein [Devosia sp.]
MSLDLDFVRSQFPALAGEWAFFDNAGGSQILKRSVERISDFLLTRNVQTGGSYDVSIKAREAVEDSRRAVATLVNAARPEEIVMGPSTTALLQNLARAMASQLSAGDEIIVTNADHESNIGPWVGLEKMGVVINTWKVNTETFELDIDDLLPLFSPRTKLVCVTHVSNLLGTINPVAEIARIVHEHGARICVDAVAYAPHGAVDVTGWDVDYYAFSFYKVFGPHHAVLYGKYEHLLELDTLYHYFYGKDKVPQKLEPGNVNYELSCGAAGMVDYLIELGGKSDASGSDRAKIVAAFTDITAHEKLIGERLLSYLRDRNDCRIIGRTSASDGRVPTISFKVDGRDSGEIAKSIDPYKVAVRFGDFHARRLAEALDITANGGVVRVSMAHYNSLTEVDKLIAALDEVL